MKKSDFYFDLPQELIAQTPIPERDHSRLLCMDKTTGSLEHRHFYNLPSLLREGDCLVINDSRVLPARLIGHRPSGGAAELVLLRELGDDCWECLSRPGKRLREGAEIIFGDGELTASVEAVLADGNRKIRFHYDGIFLEILDRLGKMPLPPYIKEELEDRERVFVRAWKRCRSHRRTALHSRAVGSDPRYGHSHRPCYTACWPRNLPSRQGGRD